MASLSDCFSKATVSTRSWTPARTRLAATMAVEPPTLPAVWTRNMGFPTAPRAWPGQLGHHHALEHVGAADDHRVDVGKGELGVGEGAQSGLAHQAGEGEVVSLGGVLGLSDADDGAALVHGSPSIRQTRFCCRQGPEVAWATARRALPSRMRFAASPRRRRPATIIGWAARAPPEGLVCDVGSEIEGIAEDDLLVAEGGVELGDIDAGAEDTGLAGGQGGGGRAAEIADAQGLRLDAVIDAADPGRAGDGLAAPRGITGGEDDGGGAVGDGRAIVLAQGGDQIGRGEEGLHVEVSAELGKGVLPGLGAVSRGDLGHLSLGAGPTSSRARAWRAARLMASGREERCSRGRAG